MALMAETPAARRAHPMPYYGYGPMPLGYGGGPYGFPAQITMRERPTIDKLCLSRRDVPRLLIFREKFVRLQQSSYPNQLLITHYLDSRVMAMLVAKTSRPKTSSTISGNRSRYLEEWSRRSTNCWLTTSFIAFLPSSLDPSQSWRWTLG